MGDISRKPPPRGGPAGLTQANSLHYVNFSPHKIGSGACAGKRSIPLFRIPISKGERCYSSRASKASHPWDSSSAMVIV